MQLAEVILPQPVPTRGGFVSMIGPGDLAEPYGLGLWQRVVAYARTLAEVAREARALEIEQTARYHGMRDA
ncbi:MAG: hypothetical protein U1F58_00345 [Burkholderiales bacterium]